MGTTPERSIKVLPTWRHAATRALAAASGVWLCVSAGCGSSSAPPSGTPATSEVALSSAVIQRLGVRTVRAEVGALPNEIQAPGVVRYDESSIVDVSVPLAGWVETSAVRAVGERVRRGDLLFEIYSPALLTTDGQYLQSLSTGASSTDNPFARGLLASGLSEDMIAAVREKRRRVGRIPFRAANDSVVNLVHAREGAYVTQGSPVVQLVSADPLWVIADVPEAAAGSVAAGTAVVVTAPIYPGWSYEGRVAHIYPRLETTSRSLQARIVVPASERPLLAGMYVSVTLHADAGEPVVQVPVSAVIRGETADRVILALDDGRFSQRAVKVGRSSGDRIAVLDGLREGDAVVTQATFLIDAEANVRASIARMDSGSAPTDPAATHEHHHSH